MATPSVLRQLISPALEPIFWTPERAGTPSAWWTHVPFAFWIVAAARPRLLVELGTHHGVSYAAFCESVVRSRLATRCFAVDTWHGDAHTEGYADAVINDLRAFHDRRYGAFSTLIRSTFDEAVPLFEDGSIDLLHIDGYHTYEAVRHDFETWLPKLSRAAVVLFHDINERQQDFGVWRLWDELRQQYPSFSFQHGHGLGVLAVGPDVAGEVHELCTLHDDADIAAARTRFSVIGHRWFIEAREQIGGAEMAQRFSQQIVQARADGAAECERIERELTSVREASAQRVRHLEEELARVQAQAARSDRLRRRMIQRNLAARAAMRNVARRADALDASLGGTSPSLLDAARMPGADQGGLLQQFVVQHYQRRSQAGRSGAGLPRSIRHWLLLGKAALRQGPRGARQVLRQLRSIDLVGRSIFFDANWYRRQYGDVGGAGIDPAEHYVRFGAREGRNPGPYFSSQFYLADNPDVARGGFDPLGHFELRGAREGRRIPWAMPMQETAAAAEPGPMPGSTSATRLVFVSGEPDTPGNRYRVLRHAEAATQAGGRASWVRADQLAGRLNELDGADILVIWRAPWDDAIEAGIRRVRARGGKIVFDVDDLMTEPDLARVEIIDGIRTQNVSEDGISRHFANVRRTMLAADCCTTTSEELAHFLRWAEKPVFVLPNGFDQATHEVSIAAAQAWRRGRNDDRIRIGYAGGSRTHQRDLALVMPALVRLLREKPACTLVFFRTVDGQVPLVDTHEFPELAGLEDRIEWRPLQTLENLPKELARFDINLAPLEVGNPFCESKSELKFFEAALVGVPTVASPTGPFRRAIVHGKSGYLATSGDDWYECLVRLADDPALRARVGRDAYLRALSLFGPLTRTRDYAGVIDQVRGGVRGVRAFALDSTLAQRPWHAPKVFDSETVFEAGGAGCARVTVVIPLYNYEKHVVEALDSVGAQTLAALDLVIVDGCSTDNSLAVARKWAVKHASRFNRIAVLRNLDNYGLGFCRNSGFDAARTPFVMLLDADNRLRPACCERLLALISDSGAGFAYSTIEHFGASSSLISKFDYSAQRFAAGNYIDAMALVSKEAWALVGGFDHVQHGWEDYDFWCRLAERGIGGRWTSEILCDYRVHPQSMMTVQTTVAGNFRRLMEDFTRRHPWVRLVDRRRLLQTPKTTAACTDTASSSRLQRILGLLRCPETGQKLILDAESGRLVSADRWRAWPVVEGRPVLVSGFESPEVRPSDHVSNELPPNAIELIESCSGPVLNLSAGGTARRYEHVIEVEHAIFRNTDLVADAHALPFDDETFDAVIVMNAFEHYREPKVAAAEIFRVLKPGGRVLVRTAFMQPQHEAPWHFYNCTRYGLAHWFAAFDIDRLHVSDNFSPNHSVAWLASECEAALRKDVSERAAQGFTQRPIGDLVDIWRDPARRDDPLWKDFDRLPQPAQEGIAAGFELLARRPAHTFSVRRPSPPKVSS